MSSVVTSIWSGSESDSPIAINRGAGLHPSGIMRRLSPTEFAYLMGYALPGHETVPEQIAADKGPYYLALEAADEEWRKGRLDLSGMEELLDECLAKQLLSAYRDASDPNAGGQRERKLH